MTKLTLNKCRIECISKMKAELEGKCLYISVDETTKACGRYIANLMVVIFLLFTFMCRPVDAR